MHPAEQYHQQGVERARDFHLRREDAALGIDEQRPGQAGECAGNREGDPLVALDVDADGGRAQRRIAPGAQCVAEGREQHAAQRQEAGDRKPDGEVVVGDPAARPLRGPGAENAVVAAGDFAPLEHDGPGDLGEGQGQHGEIDAGQAHAEPAEQDGEQGRAHRSRPEGDLHRRVGELDQQGRCVGAPAEEGGMAERDHAAGPHDEVQGGGEQHEDHDVDDQHQQEIVDRGGHGEMGDRQEQQEGEDQRAGDAQPPAGPAQRRFRRLDDAVAGDFRFAEQAPGPEDQDHRHDQEHQDQRAVGENLDAEGLEQADQDGGQEGAADAAHAADHDDDKGRRDDVEIHQQVGAALGQLDRPAQPSQRRAEKQHAGEQPALVDAEGRDHLPVEGRRAHQGAPAGAVEQQPQAGQHERRDRDQHEIVFRQPVAQDGDRPGEAGRPRADQIFRTPDPQGDVLDHQDDAEGRDQLEQLRRPVDAAQQQDFHRHADQADRCGGEQDGDPEADRAAADRGDRGHADIGAEHIEGAVGEIHDPRDAEDDRQARRHQEQGGRTGKARQQRDDEFTHGSARRSVKCGYRRHRKPAAGSRQPFARGCRPCGRSRYCLRSFLVSSTDGR